MGSFSDVQDLKTKTQSEIHRYKCFFNQARPIMRQCDVSQAANTGGWGGEQWQPAGCFQINFTFPFLGEKRYV